MDSHGHILYGPIRDLSLYELYVLVSTTIQGYLWFMKSCRGIRGTMQLSVGLSVSARYKDIYTDPRCYHTVADRVRKVVNVLTKIKIHVLHGH